MFRALVLLAVVCVAAAVTYRRPGNFPQGCHYLGQVYQEGQVIPDNDPCTHCVCRGGQRDCAIQDCAPVHCDRPYRPPGQCCPVCAPSGCRPRYCPAVHCPRGFALDRNGCQTCTCLDKW